MRPTDLFDDKLIEELVRVYRLDPEWIRMCPLPEDQGGCALQIRVSTWMERGMTVGADYAGLKAASVWLGEGPKVFIPTPSQSAALENVAVNLRFDDYRQPYPALCIKVNYPPFKAVIAYHEPEALVFSLHSADHKDDIVTTIARPMVGDRTLEESINIWDETCWTPERAAAGSAAACKALRVAANSCLALTHWGHHLKYLFPGDVDRDVRLGREDSPRGARARARLPLAPQVVSFSQTVTLHREEIHRASVRGSGEPTGAEMPTHWRRGHWAMQAYGPKHSLRKRIFRPPVLVRADLFGGERAATTTIYRG